MKRKFELSMEAVDVFLKEFEILDDLSNIEKARILQILTWKFAKKIRENMNEREKIFTAVMVIESLLRGLFPDAKWVKEVEMGHGQFRMKYMDPNFQEKEVKW